MKYVFSLILMLMLLPVGARAEETPAEIDYLLTTMSNSQCTFIRNGKEYGAQDAEAHLRMKYNRGKRYAPTTEKFIERLASKSSMSNKPYYIECDGEGRMPSGQWLTQLLNDYRAGLSASDS